MIEEKKTVKVSYKPIGFLNILFFVFLVLKLGEFGVVKHWSWWTVTSPLWAPVVIMLGIVGTALAAIVVLKILDACGKVFKK